MPAMPTEVTMNDIKVVPVENDAVINVSIKNEDPIKVSVGGCIELADVADASYNFGDYVTTESKIESGIYINSNMKSYVNSYLTTINANNAFLGSLLNTFNAPNLTEIKGTFVFNGCTKLQRAIISKGCTVIPQGTFYACRSLLDVPNAENLVNVIGQSFAYCNMLTLINLPKVEIIEAFAFAQCAQLNAVILPSINTLKANAFNNCHALQLVDVGDKCTTITNSTFSISRCQLNLIVRAIKPPTLTGVLMLGSGGKVISIKVPAQYVDVYKSAPVWSTYADIITAI